MAGKRVWLSVESSVVYLVAMLVGTTDVQWAVL